MSATTDVREQTLLIEQTPQHPLRRVFAFSRGLRVRLLLAGILGALALLSSVALMATSAYLISMAALQPPILTLQVAFVGVRAFGIGRGVFRYAERLVGHDAALRTLAGTRLAVYEALARISPSRSAIWRRGDLLNRLVNDVDQLMNLYLRVWLPYLIGLLVSLGSVALVWYFVPTAAIALAVSLAFGGIIVPLLTLLNTRRTTQETAPDLAAMSSEAVALVDHAAEMTALGQADTILARIGALDSKLTAQRRRAAKWNGIAIALGALAQGAAVVAAIVAGAAAVTAGELEPHLLAVVVLVPLAAYEAVQVLPNAALAIPEARRSAERILEIVDAPNPTPDPIHPSALPAHLQPGPFRVSDFDVCWRPGRSVISDVSFEVAPGQPLALLGRSGAGKSSILAGLTRLAPASGSVSYAGADLTRLDADDLRSVIGAVPQDSYLFDTTIAENVRLANREADEERVRAALAAVGLNDWLESLPDGENTTVGRLGAQVSGGQKQRIALARILVGDQPVVVVDEPTEYLDASSAEQVLDALFEHCRDRCLVVITHQERDAARCSHRMVLS